MDAHASYCPLFGITSFKRAPNACRGFLPWLRDDKDLREVRGEQIAGLPLTPTLTSKRAAVNEKEVLEQLIRQLYRCDTVHTQSVPIHENIKGGSSWGGIVEVFSLTNYPKTQTAYAWNYADKLGDPQYVVVLAIPPIVTALDAVRAHVAGKIQPFSLERSN